MKRLITLLMITPFLGVGCKQEVEFGSAENNSGFELVEPTPVQPDPDIEEPGQPKGPMVKIVQAPTDHKPSEGTQVVFEVIEGDNEVEKVDCYIDSYLINCDWAKGLVPLLGLPLGQHLFEVVATDVEGLVGEAKEAWNIYNSYLRQSDQVHVDQGFQMTDILFVIDNSSSMRYEQTQISQRFQKFMNQLRDIDWQIGITTTDSRQNPDYHWADGRLDPFSNRDFFLKKSLGEKEAQELFARHVRRRESGSDSERGIYTTYRAIERSLVGRSKVDRALKEFFRPQAALAVVVVSDEDESGDGKKNDGDELLKFVKDSWGQDKVFQFNSIIVHTRECLYDTGHTMGVKYERLSKKTNGLVGDVCAKNYSQILTDLGKGVANLKRVHKLKCVPQDYDGDGRLDLEIVAKNGKPVPGYTIDQETITFDRTLKVGHYEFNYYCLEE